MKNTGKPVITAYIYPIGTEERGLMNTVSNIQNLLGVHEFIGHYKNKWHGDSSHQKVVPFQRLHNSWPKTTDTLKKYNYDVYK